MKTLAIVCLGAALTFNAQAASPEFETEKRIPTACAESQEGGEEVMSYVIDVDTSTEELERIKTEAEAAGMSFKYMVRGVSKKRLVIDMVIENGEDYSLERVGITKKDGPVTLSWTIDSEGAATAFIADGATDTAVTR